MTDDEMKPLPKKRGRPPKNSAGSSYGKPTRAPRKQGGHGGAGGQQKYTEEDLNRISKPFAEMNAEERRIYNAVTTRRYRERKRAAVTEAPVFEAPKPKVGASTLLRLPELLTRVYAETDEAAQDIAGPKARAVQDVKFVLPRVQTERLRRTVAALRSRDVECDNSALVEMAVTALLTSLEEAFNVGQPFEEVEAPPVKRKPIPRLKQKDSS